MQIETICSQAGNRKDLSTGAISIPIHHSTTYGHPGFGQSTGFDYTRSLNPTRLALEETLATVHNGIRGFAFSSGMAAIDGVTRLFRPGDHVLLSDDLYGGTYRLFEQLLRPIGIDATYVDTSNLSAVESNVRPNTVALFIETPSNPTLKVTDIRACAHFTRANNLLLVVDNTFMTPYHQRPLDLGADIVVESATKYLCGHNDVLAGTLVVRDAALADRLYFIQNSVGAVLGPQDAWLLLRGMKTLHVRMERHEENARKLACWLVQHPLVSRVYYPGLQEHPGRCIHEQQSRGYGGMISFEVHSADWIAPFLEHLRVITFAESLGGVESLITYPARQTHCDIPEELRIRCGVTDRLLRLSVGIESADDLMTDIHAALTAARQEVTVG